MEPLYLHGELMKAEQALALRALRPKSFGTICSTNCRLNTRARSNSNLASAAPSTLMLEIVRPFWRSLKMQRRFAFL
jgi:hypothetical protein